MRKLSGGGGDKLGVLAYEAAALMSRAASLWRALGDGPVARLSRDSLRLEGVRRLVADDDAALLSLALAEVAAACADLSRAVARLAARCADPLLRRFDPLFAALVRGGPAADRHGLRYASSPVTTTNNNKKMDRKARKMQRLVASTAHLCHELDVLADLEHRLLRHHGAPSAEAARRVARQRREVDRLRAASLYDRTFDYAVRLLARSLFTIVARIIHVFHLQPVTTASDSSSDSTRVSRLSWSNSYSFVGSSTQSMVYPTSDVTTTDTAHRGMQRAKSGKQQQQQLTGGDARRSFLSRSKSLKQLKWPAVAAGKHLIGCVLAGSKSPVREKWVHGDLPLSFSYVSSASTKDDDDYSSSSINLQHQQPDLRTNTANKLSTTSVFESSSSSHDALITNAPETTLGAAALSTHYSNLIIFVERLAAAPRDIGPDERDALYGMLTGSIRASLRSRLCCRRPSSVKRPHHRYYWSSSSSPCNDRDDDAATEQWADKVRRVLGWLAPLAHNTVRWHAERNFEQRNNAASSGGGGGSVMLFQTLHFADRVKTEAAVTELLVGLDYLWRSGS